MKEWNNIEELREDPDAERRRIGVHEKGAQDEYSEEKEERIYDSDEGMRLNEGAAKEAAGRKGEAEGAA